MSQLRVGIIGAGWPGAAHAKGYLAAGGFKLIAVADLVPERRKKLMGEFQIPREYPDAMELVKQKDIDVISVCLPNHLHAPVALAAIRKGKHVVCEPPCTLNSKEARRLQKSALGNNRVLLYAFQRRFGAAESASKQAILKGYAGDVYHVRATWTRTRGVPIGTGWYTQKSQSGGGALIDIGIHMLDLAWNLLGQPQPVSAFGFTHSKFASLAPPNIPFDVDDAAFALIRFDNGKTLELATSWAINQSPSQNGTICRAYGDAGAIEVYTPSGPILYRGFAPGADPAPTVLKGPKLIHHAAMMRHFKDCIGGKAQPVVGPAQGLTLMQMIDAIYKSAQTGKSVNVK